jgi:F420-0:gamma-glutamyl ligase-like protein
MTLTFTPLPKIPLIHTGDDLIEILLNSMQAARVTLEDGDILVLAQKIVSKAEGVLHLQRRPWNWLLAARKIPALLSSFCGKATLFSVYDQERL